MITILSKSYHEEVATNNAFVHSVGTATHEMLEDILAWKDSKTEYYQVKQKDLYDGHEFYIRINGIPNQGQDNKLGFLYKLKVQGEALITLCNINQGVLTGLDKITNRHIKKGLIDEKFNNHGVYVINMEELLSLNLREHEKKIIFPFFKNSDIKRYFCIQEPKLYLIYATRDLDIEDYPRLYSHFKRFESAIRERSQERGEMQAALKLGKWWVIFAARDESIFLKQKIICPQRSYENTFAYNETIWFSSADVYFITQKAVNISLKYVLALLNSKLYYLWLYHMGKRKGEMLELFYTPLSEIPIKSISISEQKPFTEIVDKILAITKNEDYMQNPTKQSQVKVLEQEIDQLVYRLYDLTEEEIRIVEGVDS